MTGRQLRITHSRACTALPVKAFLSLLQAETRVAPYGAKVYQIIGAISKLRGSVGGGKDQGIVKPNASNIVPTDGEHPTIWGSINGSR